MDMSDRPIRERKLPKRLESEQEYASPTSANVGRKPPSTKKAEATPEVKQEERNAEPRIATGRGKDRGWGDGRGRGQGRRSDLGRRRCRGRGGGEITSRPSKRRRIHSSASGDEHDPPTSPIDDGAALNGFDHDYNDNGKSEFMAPSKISKAATRRNTKVSEELVPSIPTEDDVTIEQWYADPYERLNPEDPAYDEWRRKNLEENMVLQGINLIRAKPVASWLMSCKGRYKPFSSPKKRATYKKSRKRGVEDQDPGKKSSQTPDDDIQSYIDDDTMDADANDEFKHQQSVDSCKGNTLKEEDDIAETSVRRTQRDAYVKSDAVCKDHDATSGNRKAGRGRAKSTVGELAQTVTGSTVMSLKPEPGHLHGFSQPRGGDAKLHVCNEQDIGEQIEVLKKCMQAFQIVYGKEFENLPSPDYSNYEIKHVSSTTKLPRAVPKAGFHTQGHKPLQYAKAVNGSAALTNHMLDPKVYEHIEVQATHGPLHNQTRVRTAEVLTEDPHFGNLPFDCSQDYTLEEREMLKVQNDRKALQRNGSRPYNGRAEEAEHNDLERQLVLQQLKRKVFSWETEWTIAGVLTDANGMPSGNFYRVREDNEKWKRLVERQAILATRAMWPSRSIWQIWRRRKTKREERRNLSRDSVKLPRSGLYA